jgi:hypothetical protein
MKGDPLQRRDVGAALRAEWDAQRSVVTVNARRSKAFIGFVGAPYNLGGVTIAPAPNMQNWAAIRLTAMDGRDFRSPGRVLITATGFAENTGMGWRNPERSTVGRDWGRAPSRVEGIPATITLPVPAGHVRAWALDERGRRRADLQVRDAGGKATIRIRASYHTFWYEVAIQ